MKKTIIFISLAIFSVLLLRYSVKYWPRSNIQDYAIIWLYDKELREIFGLADKTPYNRIIWIEPLTYKAGSYINGVISWDDTADLSILINAAKRSGFNSLELMKTNEHWFFPSYSDIVIYSDEPNNTSYKRTDTYYRYGGKLGHPLCENSLIKSTANGKCEQRLFDNWIVEKNWYLINIYTNH